MTGPPLRDAGVIARGIADGALNLRNVSEALWMLLKDTPDADLAATLFRHLDVARQTADMLAQGFR